MRATVCEMASAAIRCTTRRYSSSRSCGRERDAVFIVVLPRLYRSVLRPLQPTVQGRQFGAVLLRVVRIGPALAPPPFEVLHEQRQLRFDPAHRHLEAAQAQLGLEVQKGGPFQVVDEAGGGEFTER